MHRKNTIISLLSFLTLMLPASAGAVSPQAPDSISFPSETKDSISAAKPEKSVKSIYIPKFTGTVRARYEYLTQENLSAFKVRDLRLGIEGYVAPIMSYNGEVSFSDWGKIVLVNAFIKLEPIKGLSFILGQQRVPFTIAAHRLPCEQFFVNRTFLAKYAGIRDIGLVGGYVIPKFPLTIQASVFNSSGVGDHKIYFTNTYGFSVKLISRFHPGWFLSASTAHQKKGTVWMQNWDIGGYFDNGLWHVEAEYLRKNFRHHAFDAVNAFDFFVYRLFPIEKKMIGGVSGAIRYDYISDHSNGILGDDGHLTIDMPECHRLTAGATLSLATKFQADIRLNYEKYFYHTAPLSPTDGDRLVLELIAHF